MSGYQEKNYKAYQKAKARFEGRSKHQNQTWQKYENYQTGNLKQL